MSEPGAAAKTSTESGFPADPRNDRGRPLIVVKDLSAGYEGRVILKDVSFVVYPGEIFVVLGGSGCGKSTLLKHMIGLYRPLHGEILYEDEDITRAEGQDLERILRRFGVLYQSGALLSSMTVGENVALPLEEFTTLDRGQIDLTVRLKLQLVHLQGYEDLYPAQLSGGMRKRAALARAMALDPEILFFDEPSAGLDPITSADLDSLILQINATLGTTMVMVTHELESIMATARRVIMLDGATHGIIAEGDPHVLREQTSDPRVHDFFHRKPSLGRR